MLRRGCVQVITRNASTRVAEYAFKYARDNGRKRVNSIHKANIMKMADGLFIKCCREVQVLLRSQTTIADGLRLASKIFAVYLIRL